MKILCFGDSLTCGYYHSPGDFVPLSFPYGDFLQQKLRFSYDESWTVVSSGECGEMAMQMRHRLPQVLNMHLSQEEHDKLQFTVILGGANDIGWGRNADEVIEDLQALHRMCWAKGVRTLGLSIPPSLFELDDENRDLKERRLSLNSLLEKYILSSDMGMFVDLAKSMSLSKLASEEIQQQLWAEDKLHFRQAGYEFISNVVFDALKNII